jgi:hypothetical protein
MYFFSAEAWPCGPSRQERSFGTSYPVQFNEQRALSEASWAFSSGRLLRKSRLGRRRVADQFLSTEDIEQVQVEVEGSWLANHVKGGVQQHDLEDASTVQFQAGRRRAIAGLKLGRNLWQPSRAQQRAA